jgi:hypothetical protein
VESWLKYANELGIWDIISTVVVVGSLLIAFKIFFLPKKRVPHLNFFLIPIRDDSNYPFKILIEIRNYTGEPLLISFPIAVMNGNIRPDPHARGNSSSRELEVKFPAVRSIHPPEPKTMMYQVPMFSAGQTPLPLDVQPSNLTEIECLLRHGETVSTLIPIDPTHTDEEVENAMRNGTVGTLECTCTWLGKKVGRHRVKFPLRT